MKKIIVPIDFSEESLKGLKLAIIYANKFEADIQMVYVQQSKPGKFRIELKNEYDQAMNEFQNIIEKYRPSLSVGSDISYIIKSGKVFEEVANQAEAFDDSVIICSTNGESGFTEYFIGSNSYRIIHKTRRPVITATTDKYIGDVKRIILPIDVTKETREKVPKVISIAKAFDAEVHIVKVSTASNEGIHNKLELYSKQVRSILDEYGIRHQSILLVGDNITDMTIEYAVSVDADLIAIMTEQASTFSNFLLGSYAHQMLNASPVPVLSITPKDLFFVYGMKSTGEA